MRGGPAGDARAPEWLDDTSAVEERPWRYESRD